MPCSVAFPTQLKCPFSIHDSTIFLLRLLFDTRALTLCPRVEFEGQEWIRLKASESTLNILLCPKILTSRDFAHSPSIPFWFDPWIEVEQLFYVPQYLNYSIGWMPPKAKAKIFVILWHLQTKRDVPPPELLLAILEPNQIGRNVTWCAGILAIGRLKADFLLEWRLNQSVAWVDRRDISFCPIILAIGRLKADCLLEWRLNQTVAWVDRQNVSLIPIRLISKVSIAPPSLLTPTNKLNFCPLKAVASFQFTILQQLHYRFVFFFA